MQKLSSSGTETYLKTIQMFDGYVPIHRVIDILQIVFGVSHRDKEAFRIKVHKTLEKLHQQQYIVIKRNQIFVKITEHGERYLLKLLHDKLPPNPFDEV